MAKKLLDFANKADTGGSDGAYLTYDENLKDYVISVAVPEPGVAHVDIAPEIDELKELGTSDAQQQARAATLAEELETRLFNARTGMNIES